jgi:hypothetical protein
MYMSSAVKGAFPVFATALVQRRKIPRWCRITETGAGRQQCDGEQQNHEQQEAGGNYRSGNCDSAPPACLEIRRRIAASESPMRAA